MSKFILLFQRMPSASCVKIEVYLTTSKMTTYTTTSSTKDVAVSSYQTQAES